MNPITIAIGIDKIMPGGTKQKTYTIEMGDTQLALTQEELDCLAEMLGRLICKQ